MIRTPIKKVSHAVSQEKSMRGFNTSSIFEEEDNTENFFVEYTGD